MAISKVILNGEVQMDVTSDTVEANKLLSGETATKNDGTKVTGTYIAPNPQIESLAVTPTEEQQTFNNAAIDGYKPVTVNAIDSEYVGSDVPRKSSVDLTVSGATVSVPAGYYADNASKAISNGSAKTPNTSITANPTISINSTGLITASESGSKSVTPEVSAGYISEGTAGTISVSGSATKQLTTQAAKIVTPTETEQTAVAANIYTTGAVKVGAVDSGYIGSGVVRRSSDDLTVSGPTISVPAGYYSEESSKSAASGTAGIPTASKGTVSNHSVNITPSVTNTEGYISGGTKTGSAVNVSASELVSGTKSITENGSSIDVTNYASVNVEVPDIPAVLQEKSATPTESTQTITADSGYDGLSEVEVGAISSTYIGSGIARKSSIDLTASGATVAVPSGYYAEDASKAVASGTEGTPIAIKGTVSNNSVSITPSVINTEGYISGGTKTGSTVNVSASELVSGTKAITENGSGIDVTNYSSVDVAIPGPTLQTKTKSYTPTETAQSETISPDTGYDGLESIDISVGAISPTYVGSGITRRSSSDLTASGATVAVPAGYYPSNASKSVSAGSATPVSSLSATGSLLALAGGNSITLRNTISNTPVVTSGYISKGTAGDTTVSLTASMTTKAASTITPGTANQTIPANVYLLGAQTILGDANLKAANIVKGTSIFGVNGSYAVTPAIKIAKTSETGKYSSDVTFSDVDEPSMFMCIYDPAKGSSGQNTVMAYGVTSNTAYGYYFDGNYMYTLALSVRSSALSFTRGDSTGGWSYNSSQRSLTISPARIGTNNTDIFIDEAIAASTNYTLFYI